MRLKSPKSCSWTLSTLAERLWEQQFQNEIVELDNSGKSANNNKYNDDLMKKVKAHVKSFPVMESHYNC